MTIKEKADALVEQFYNIQVPSYFYSISANMSIYCAIKSVEHTIEELRQLNGLMIKAEDCMIISQKITEQTELLTELKSRL